MHKRFKYVVLALMGALSVVMAPALATAEYVNVVSQNERTLNLRAGPGLSNDVLTELQQNTFVDVIGANGRWRQVRLSDGSLGWVHARYLGDGPAAYFPAFVATHRITDAPRGFMNLREGPSTQFAIVARGYQNDDLMATGQTQGRWLQVQLPNFDRVWIHGSGVSKLNSQPTVVVDPPVTRPQSTVEQIACRARRLSRLDGELDAEIAALNATVTPYDQRRLAFSQLRFDEFQVRDCKLNEAGASSRAEFARMVGCLVEVKNLRLWQLRGRYIDNYVTPDNAIAADRAPFANAAAATPVSPIAEPEPQPEPAAINRVTFTPPQRLLPVLAGVEVIVTNDAGREIAFLSGEVSPGGGFDPLVTDLGQAEYDITHRLYYLGGAVDEQINALTLEGTSSCTLFRRALSCARE